MEPSLCIQHGERIAILEVTVKELTEAVTRLTDVTTETHKSFQQAMSFGKGVIWVLGVIATTALAVAALLADVDLSALG